MSDHDVVCGECGAKMVLRKSPKYPRPFWGCSQFPKCRGTHGAHPDGRPLGKPADRETKQARILAHNSFDRLWLLKHFSRKNAYKALAAEMGLDQIHIGECSKEECKVVIRAADSLLKKVESGEYARMVEELHEHD